jgi:hypothetical protein
MSTANSKSQQQDQPQQQSGAISSNSNNLWNSDISRANQQLGGVSAANFGMSNDAVNLGRNNVMDALMIARLQQNQDQQQQQQQQHDALRRLSIDTIGSSHRSVGLDGANGLMSVAGRLNTNNLIQQAHSLQQQQNLLNSNNQFFTSQQRDLQSQLQQAGIGGGNGMGGGLYPRSESLSFMQNFDPSSAAAVANLRFQQGLTGMGQSALNSSAGSNLSQSLLAHNLLPGNNLDFSNSGPNPMLDVDFLYRALFQQQQQKQQSDSLLNLQLNQQQFMPSFGNDPNSRTDLSGGLSGLDNLTHQNRFQQQSGNGQQAGRSIGTDQLDWSRNSESNIDSTTLLSLQQQQQKLQQQQQQQIAEINHLNYPSMQGNQMMNLEEQLAMNSSMWNHPSTMMNLQQQNQLISQQFHGIGGNLEGEMANGGIGSNSLLTALFAESGQAPYDLGLPVNAAASLGNLASSLNNETGASAGTKPTKVQAETTAQLPIRALSAYNFFFRDERERIINCDDGDDPLDPASLKAKRDAVSFNEEKKKLLLSGHWFRDRTAKRRHRKTHGKIAFTALSKVIAQAWRDLPESEKAFYREVAADDLERYQRELEQYKVVDGVDVGNVPKSGINLPEAQQSDESGREPV